MQKEKRVAIIGGDARYLPLIHTLNKTNEINLELIGFDQVEQSYTGVKQSTLEELKPEQLDAVILPITGIDDKGYAEAVFSKQELQLTKDWFKRLPSHCLVFTGIANQTLLDSVKIKGNKLIKLMERNDVAIYNSIPTAEGAIMLAIQHTDITIHQSEVFVYGFGRVGKTTASAFKGLGAKVTVVSKDETDIARAFEQGYTVCHLSESIKLIENCHVLVNTIPAKVINKPILEKMKSDAIVIDLASKPGGTDFDFAKARGIHAIHALGLPGLVAPKTAGEILAFQIQKFIFSS
ncbi:dipicolinic acid synthetase subunit A [Gracilibacillus sp. YIM 98692]|uniref:dipicolinic acid synthetase subunit A n=1 Tax=Gracilibacillus sp. YIM 98692 TaxID=2663532 RepID=UPI0013D6C551|nr:dipicolinic acid synthetase subunit A [Gracilibacillus sp. YIM 98692]